MTTQADRSSHGLLLLSVLAPVAVGGNLAMESCGLAAACRKEVGEWADISSYQPLIYAFGLRMLGQLDCFAIEL